MNLSTLPDPAGVRSPAVSLERATAGFFALFLFASAISIAMAHISLGLTLCALCGLMLANRRWPEDLGPRPVYFAIGAYVGWLVISSLAGASPLSSLISLKEEGLFVILPIGILLGRLYIWNQSWQITLNDPITGVGPGNFVPAYSAHLPDDAAPYHYMGHAHNDYLNLSAQTGIPGLLLYLTVWGVIIARLWRRSRDDSAPAENRALANAALLASLVFCTASMTEAAFADEELRQLITALWALGLSEGGHPVSHSRADSLEPERPEVS